jgi:phospholipase C
MRVSRTNLVIAASLLVVFAAVAAACTSDSTTSSPASSAADSTAADPPGDGVAPLGTVDRATGQSIFAPPDPVTAPLPENVDASGFDTRWPIKHVVFLILENRSFDNIFGLYPGAEGATTGMDHDVERPLTKATLGRGHDLPHCYNCNVASIDGGRMDGFNQTEYADRYAYTVYHPDQIRPFYSLADDYVLSDNFFASATGPSFPNHMFTIAAQSGGALDNPWQPFPRLKDQQEAGYAKSWGCDIAEGGYVEVIDPEGVMVKVKPCFDFETEGDLLSGKNIPWAYYSATNTQLGYIWSAYAAIDRYRNDPELWGEHMRPVDDVFRDVAAGRLPPVSWITPRFQLSQHPEYNFCWGMNWTVSLVNEIMRSPLWKNTAIFLTWDDFGGFYDHMPPIVVDRFGFGIRVPMLVVSPYAKQGYIDSNVGEFSSVLRFIEDNWGLSQLTHRDRDAKNMTSVFDFGQEPRAAKPLELSSDCRGPIWDAPEADAATGAG